MSRTLKKPNPKKRNVIDHAHVFQFKWNGMYRKCVKDDCTLTQWLLDNEYYEGKPCSIDMFFDLSGAAIGNPGGKRSKASEAGNPNYITKWHKSLLESENEEGKWAKCQRGEDITDEIRSQAGSLLGEDNPHDPDQEEDYEETENYN